MKKRLVSLLLVLTLVLSVFPLQTFAASQTAKNIKVEEAKYSSTGLFSVTTSFEWSYTGVRNARLILLDDRLKGSYENSGVSGYGDFTDFGNIGSKRFSNYEAAKAYDDQTNAYRFLAASANIPAIYNGDKITVVFSGLENAVPLNKDDTYFVYLWVTFGSKFYPDNLICVIRVKDGELTFTPATKTETYRNHYDSSEESFTEIKKSENRGFDLYVIPGSNMKHVISSGAEEQLNLNDPIVDIIYEADPGYWFPENYSIQPIQNARIANNMVNGITMTRADDGSRITLSGKLIDFTRISLPHAERKPSSHTHTPTNWDYDDATHWKYECIDPACPDDKDTARTNEGLHNHNLEGGTKCECGHTITPEHICTPSTTYLNQDPSEHWKYLCTDPNCTKGNYNKIDPATRGEHHYDTINDLLCDTCGYVREAHPCTESGWLYNDAGHWKQYCTVNDCANRNTKKSEGAHVFTDDNDTTCNTCGYTRIAPAEKPDTGDITNIPLWTALFLGGMALLWVQLEQRKRQQF